MTPMATSLGGNGNCWWGKRSQSRWRLKAVVAAAQDDDIDGRLWWHEGARPKATVRDLWSQPWKSSALGVCAGVAEAIATSKRCGDVASESPRIVAAATTLEAFGSGLRINLALIPDDVGPEEENEKLLQEDAGRRQSNQGEMEKALPILDQNQHSPMLYMPFDKFNRTICPLYPPSPLLS
ncbi:hypothetical protein U1Q18_007951 [Sarracenia purpurea var. burkii]